MSVGQINESAKYRILESSSWKEPQEGFSPISSSKQGQLWDQVRALISWVLKPPRNGVWTTSLGNLLRSLTVYTVKFFSLSPVWANSCFSLCPFSLMLQSCSAAKGLTPSSWSSPCTCWKDGIRSTCREESLLLGHVFHPQTMPYVLVVKANCMAEKLCHGANETFVVG